jgi:hypothetical protein
MWKNISNLWDKKDNNILSDNNNINVNELMSLMNDTSVIGNSVVQVKSQSKSINSMVSTQTNTSFILTESSPRFSTPECPIKLWPHQEAMLHRIKQIETSGYTCKTESKAAIRFMDKSLVGSPPDVILGVMNDPPGSGKTYAILTQILIDRTPGATIIIVPQNIYAQWRQSIETIFKNQSNKCKFVSMYGDVLDIFANPHSVNGYKVILLQDNFAEAYLKTLNDKNISVARIVIDEIDIMDGYVMSSVPSRFVWLMSASYTDQKVLGPYHIGDHTKVVCKCDANYVAKSLNLPPPKIKRIECSDTHIELFRDILDAKQMKALNAGDHNILNRIMNRAGLITPALYKDIVGKYVEYLLQKAELLPEAEKDLENFVFTDDRSEKEYNILRDKVTMLRMFKKNANILQSRQQYLIDSFLQSCKEVYLEGEFVDKMESDKSTKWLIFNDNGNVLVKYQELLLKKNIKAVMLDGGNQKLIEKSLKDYKEGEVQVLLLNSMIEGAGMNLENTTHLLFMHKTEEKFIEQVMGRAQRYGRKGPLNVIMLFNKNE